MVCYHHNDLDGKSAAYCVHKFKPSDIQDTTGSYISCTYNDEFDKHSNNDIVFIVDLSISESTYEKLLTVCRTARRVIWIDHHTTSMQIINAHKEELQNIGNLIYFVSDVACGAALTYAFLHCSLEKINKLWNRDSDTMYQIKANYSKPSNSTKDNPIIDISIIKFDKDSPASASIHNETIPLPMWLYYVDDYDCWKKQDERTEAFTLGLDSENYNVTRRHRDTEVFNDIFDRLGSQSFLDSVIARGLFISEYLRNRYRSELKNTFEWTYEGTTFLCKNGTGNSWNFDRLIERYDAVILFYYEGAYGKWKYSVYSNEKSNFSCEQFAKKFGGGGHTKAAGFSTDKLIFTTNEYSAMKKKEQVIFLGGTCEGNDWRGALIAKWKKAMNSSDNKKINHIDLFNPVVPEWSEQARLKENEIKNNAIINLFVITPDMRGDYSIAEAVECSHKAGCKSILIIYDKYDNGFDMKQKKSFDAIGKIIESNGGVYKYTSGENALDELVDILIKEANKIIR